MRVPIIGAGSMGHPHGAGWAATDATLVGVVAANPGSAKPLADRFGANVYASLGDVLPLVDVVDICVPTDLHLDFTLQAAAAGKHVLCEKPIARQLSDGQTMIAACRDAGVRLFVGMTARFFPQYRAVHEAVTAGRVGKPAVIRLTRGSYRPHNATDNWFSDFARSGGPLLDMLIHDYDYARWLAGEVERVYTHSTPPDSGGVRDYAQVLLRFRNGAMAHMEGGWAYPPPLFRTKIEVAGDGGLIEWESDNSAPMVSHFKVQAGAVAEVGVPLSPLAGDPDTTTIKHFHRPPTTDKPLFVPPFDSFGALVNAPGAPWCADSGKAL